MVITSMESRPPASLSQISRAAGPVRGVLFDLDGVLIDSAQAWHHVVQLGAQRFGGPAVAFEVFAETFGQGPDADQRAFYPGGSVDEVKRFYADTFPQHLDTVELVDGSLRVLAALRERGIRRAVVTNTPRELANKVLAAKGIAPLVDTVAAAGDAPEKPAPNLINLALAHLGLETCEVLYVGDSESDRAATRAAGVRMAGLNYPGDITIGVLDELLQMI